MNDDIMAIFKPEWILFQSSGAKLCAKLIIDSWETASQVLSALLRITIVETKARSILRVASIN